MNKAKLFYYDFITDKKSMKYIAAVVMFIAAALYFRINNPHWSLGTAAMSNIGLSIAFMTTMYSIFSYSTMDRIKAYLMLPCKKSEVFFSFVFAQYYTLLLERMSFVIVAAVLFTENPAVIIAYLLLSSLAAVMLDTVFMMALNRKGFITAAFCLLSVVSLYALLSFSRNVLLNLTALIAILSVAALLLATFQAKHLGIIRESKVRAGILRRANYFLVVLLREKMVLVNTAGIFVIAALFAFAARETPFLLNILWGIIAMNTPAATMFSADKALLRHEKMLPRRSHLMSGVYAFFLGSYFMAANAYVVLIFLAMGHFTVFVPILAVIFTVADTALSLYLERKYPIKNWQKKQEVWRSPRKYIVPVIVCVAAMSP
jgi:hypothetical protein